MLKILWNRDCLMKYLLDNSGTKEIVHRSKPYVFYETAVLNFYPGAIKTHYTKIGKHFSQNAIHSFTAKEFFRNTGSRKRKEVGRIFSKINLESYQVKTALFSINQ